MENRPIGAHMGAGRKRALRQWVDVHKADSERRRAHSKNVAYSMVSTAP